MLFYYRWKLLTPNDEFRSEADFTVEKLRKYLVMGSPDDCVQQLERWTKAIDADYVIMRFRLPKGPAPGRVLDCIRQFGEDVIPKFRDR
jgi:alkanesulfonate monooxygenase SsuD/methylene tetrahydromethanopterin reductase-like flavin-dependent oxidoreductase (luciferase family)